MKNSSKKAVNKKTLIISLVIILVIILSLFISLYIINYNKIDEIQGLEEFTDYDVSVNSYLDLMPSPNKSKNYAYFDLIVNGITKDEFLNNYKIDKIYLNNKIIEISDIENFRFYSSKTKKNNVIYIIIKNLNTNVTYYKKLEVSTKSVY